MARINIEESWWSDTRRQKLVRLFKGDARLADGLMIQAWRLAQKYSDSKFLIPMSEFLCLEDAEFLFECFLADACMASADNPRLHTTNSKQCLEDLGKRLVTLGDYVVYLRGSEKHLDWIAQQRAKGRVGGQRSALRPRDTRGRLLPKVQAKSKQRLDNSPSGVQAVSKQGSNDGPSQVQPWSNDGIRLDHHEMENAQITPHRQGNGGINGGIHQAKSKQRLDNSPSQSKGLQASLSSSSSLSLSSSSSDFGDCSIAVGGRLPKGSTNPLWLIYETGIERKYGVKPSRGPKINGQLAAIARSCSQPEAIELVEFYLKHPRVFYNNTKHDLGPLVADLHKLRIEMKTGVIAPDFQNGKTPNGRWLTSEEKKRQNTEAAVLEAINDLSNGQGDFHG